jgi:hypothetical protein
MAKAPARAGDFRKIADSNPVWASGRDKKLAEEWYTKPGGIMLCQRARDRWSGQWWQFEVATSGTPILKISDGWLTVSQAKPLHFSAV